MSEVTSALAEPTFLDKEAAAKQKSSGDRGFLSGSPCENTISAQGRMTSVCRSAVGQPARFGVNGKKG